MVMVMVGASHHDVTLDEVSRLTAAGEGLARKLTQSSPDINGAVVLSTCNRFEIYLDLERFHDAVELTTASVAQAARLDPDFVVDAMRVLVGTAVGQHLFSVASGLESMVVGEDEIAGQVRQALATAQEERTTSPTLERLLQRALATSKAVTSSTGLGAAGRSIVSVGLDVAEQRYGSLAGRRALILGTGSYARVVTAALQKLGCVDIHVYSSSGRAAQFAHSRELVPVESEQLIAAIADAQLIAACSGTSEYLVDQSVMVAARGLRGSGDIPVIPIIDLALTPDVAPEVAQCAWADVINLEVIREFAPREHSSAILEAQDIVLQAVAEFELTESGRSADHAVVAMRTHVMSIINEEMERIRTRVDADTAEEVARALHRVSNTILHTPSIRAQELARTGDFADYQKAIHTLFGIDLDARG
ncbi:MAG: glutamyl-tRNA reductase [Actinomycetota bacterium]|nr:glutamyl-tRNA reductase [Actinomycetota bacterium]MDP2289360.1 glutamyl-tRNA reductase [Actinomycetota bacterium]